MIYAYQLSGADITFHLLIMKLSIIIPVYNVEKYIERCLMSCVKQDISTTEYEIIVVNDGTPDGSMSIAERIATEHPNIHIIHQKNQGLSVARNNGLAVALGEYIWFIDSDDYIEENCLHRITKQLRDNLDILQLQFRKVYENGLPSVNEPFCTINGIMPGWYVTEHGGLPHPAQLSVLRSKFLKDKKLQFVPGIYHEDAEFKPRATFYANKIASDNAISYNYLQRSSGSITSSYKLKNGLDLLTVMNNLLNFTKENNLSKKSSEAFFRQIGLNMNSLLYGYRQLSDTDKSTLKKELSNQAHLFKYMCKSKKLKYQIEGYCFGLSIAFGLFLHRLIR